MPYNSGFAHFSKTWKKCCETFVPCDEWEIIENCNEVIFTGEMQEYASITELDEEILNRMIDKIFINTAEIINGEKVQKVRIVYNFAGEIGTYFF